MKSVLYVVRNPPGPLANETIDAILVSGVFEQRTSVLFLGDGVRQLFGDGSVIGRKDTKAALSALPTYDVTEVYVAEESIQKAGLESSDLPEYVKIANLDRVRELIHSHDIVIND